MISTVTLIPPIFLWQNLANSNNTEEKITHILSEGLGPKVETCTIGWERLSLRSQSQHHLNPKMTSNWNDLQDIKRKVYQYMLLIFTSTPIYDFTYNSLHFSGKVSTDILDIEHEYEWENFSFLAKSFIWMVEKIKM